MSRLRWPSARLRPPVTVGRPHRRVALVALALILLGFAALLWFTNLEPRIDFVVPDDHRGWLIVAWGCPGGERLSDLRTGWLPPRYRIAYPPDGVACVADPHPRFFWYGEERYANGDPASPTHTGTTGARGGGFWTPQGRPHSLARPRTSSRSPGSGQAIEPGATSRRCCTSASAICRTPRAPRTTPAPRRAGSGCRRPHRPPAGSGRRPRARAPAPNLAGDRVHGRSGARLRPASSVAKAAASVS